MIPLLAIKTALGGAWAVLRNVNPLVIIIALLGLSLALTWHNADGWKARDAKHVAAYRDEVVAHAVTAKSLDDLQHATDVQNAAVETMRKAGVSAYVQAIAARDKARADSVSSLALADRLQRGAGKAAACVTPPEIMEANGL